MGLFAAGDLDIAEMKYSSESPEEVGFLARREADSVQCTLRPPRLESCGADMSAATYLKRIPILEIVDATDLIC